jgi:thiol-disulfide isomerase/thioredoxin
MLSAFAQQPDSVTVIGQLLGNCSFTKITIKEFSVSSGMSLYAETNVYGLFKLRIPVYGPQQFTLTAGKLRYDFLVNPAQTEYRFAITCRQDGDFNVKLDDSKENDAFELLGKIEKSVVTDATYIAQHNKNPDSLRIALQNLCLAQKHNLDQVADAYPHTFTSSVLASACSLPIVLPHENYLDSFIFYTLRNPVWNDVTIYHTDFPLSFISLIKALFSKKSEDEKDEMINCLLSASPSNPEAAKLFQQCLSEYLFYQLEENRLRAFCKWAEEHPDKVPNEALKAKLHGMKKILPGSDYINVLLKDSSGTGRSLASEVEGHKYMLVLFWSPECEHCIAEMPALISFYKKYHPQGIEVYAVAIDCEEGKWKTFIAKNTPPWINVRDDGGRADNIASDYMINYTPTLVLIDKAGKIQSRFGSLEWIEKILYDNGIK